MMRTMSTQDGRFSTVIRKRLRKAFFAETNKGKLVNDLLVKYYAHEKKDAG